MPYFSGKISSKGSIALFEQEPVLFSGTVRSNILFGKKFDKDLYQEALRMSCLNADCKILERGDQTLVG
jgi:ATP-binding cassette, subfamily C (CFTR/MRP), member 4